MPIISGLVSGLDTESIVNQLAEINKAPIKRIEAKKAQLNEKLSSWQSFSLKMLDLKVNATALSSRLRTGSRAVSSSLPEEISVAVSGSPDVGSYAVKVNKLAQGQMSLSQGFGATDATVMTSGTLTFKAGNGTDDRDVSGTTLLSRLNNGNGVSLGSIKITDRSGTSATINLASATTVQDVLDLISGNPGIKVTAVLNEKGNGLRIVDDSGLTNGNLIIEEVGGGQSAQDLGILTAVGGVTAKQYIGSDLDPLYSITIDNTNNTLEKLKDEINNLGGPFSAAILNEGSGASPYRLSITSRETGSIGAIAIATPTAIGGSLTFSTLQSAQDAELEVGSTNPQKFYSHTNQVSNVIPGVTMTLRNPTTQAAQISVYPEVDSLVEAVKTFVSVYNDLADAVHKENQYNADTRTPGGALFGDSTLQSMMQDITRNLLNPVAGLPSTASSIFQIGVEPGPSGTLKINESVLAQKLATDFDNVKAILTQKTDITEQALASASSTASGYSISALSDGDKASASFGPGTGWMGTNAAGAETLNWIFDTPRYISGATINTADTLALPAAQWGIRDYDLQALILGGNPSNAADWTTVASVRGNLKGELSHGFSAYTTRIRMNILGTNASDGFARLSEVRLDEASGAAVRLNNVLGTMTNSASGTVFGVQDTITDQMSTMDRDIARLNDRLSKQMAFLSKQFAQMEQSLAELQRAGNFLSAFSGISTSSAASNARQGASA